MQPPPAPAPAFGSGPARRIVQLHPTLRCNLRCRHCYSESGPQEEVVLDARLVCEALDDAAALGYATLSVSGGEPLLFEPLAEVLAHARALGMEANVATNGTLLSGRRFTRIAEVASGLAVSVDGPPELHDHVRASPTAWARTARGLASLAASGLPFAIIHTLTRSSWAHLPWLADLAVAHGARALQVHPLELAGRAERELAAMVPGPAERARAFLVCASLQAEHGDALLVQLDLLLRRALLDDPEVVYAGEGSACGTPADRLGVLVLEADGVVSPVCFGFDRRFALGRLGDAPLRELWERWAAEREAPFRALCREVLEELRDDEHAQLVNWTERVVARSRLPAAA